MFANFRREYDRILYDNITYLESLIRRVSDVRKLYGWEEHAEAKYGHLIPEGWRPRKRNEDGTFAPDELYVDNEYEYS